LTGRRCARWRQAKQLWKTWRRTPTFRIVRPIYLDAVADDGFYLARFIDYRSADRFLENTGLPGSAGAPMLGLLHDTQSE
jgi:hypothetical protein